MLRAFDKGCWPEAATGFDLEYEVKTNTHHLAKINALGQLSKFILPFLISYGTAVNLKSAPASVIESVNPEGCIFNVRSRHSCVTLRA